MTFLDIIELWNINNGKEIDDIESMFEDIEIDERVDKSIMCGVLLQRCGAMTALYNTTSTFKYFSNNFFKKYKLNISKLIDTTEFEYNPIENKKVSWVETTDIEQNLDTAEDTTENRSRDNTGTVVNEYDNSETNTISAMNSNTYEPDNKSEGDGENTRTDDLNESIEAAKERNKNENLDWNEKDTHEETGLNNANYQDLIEKERKVDLFNIYNWIADRYAAELFLLVY